MFKVIGIETLPYPLKGNGNQNGIEKMSRLPGFGDIIKVLKPNQIYYFVGGYKIENGNVSLDDNQTRICEDFYSNGNINIMVSAIVAENGQGKSTLIDLLLRVMHNLSVILDRLRLEVDRLNLNFIYNLYCRVYFEDEKGDIYVIEQKNQSFKLWNCSDPKILLLNSDEHKKILGSIELINGLFYVLSVNYSNYTMRLDNNLSVRNNKYEYKWLENRERVRDSYKIAYQIVPARRKGLINYGLEREQVAERLYYLLLNNSQSEQITLIDKKKITGLLFSIHGDRKSKTRSGNAERLLKSRLEIFRLENKGNMSDEEIQQKIAQMTHRIIHTLSDYFKVEIKNTQNFVEDAWGYAVLEILQLIIEQNRRYASKYKKIKEFDETALDYAIKFVLKDRFRTRRLRRCLAYIKTHHLFWKYVTENNGIHKITIDDYIKYIASAINEVGDCCDLWEKQDFWPAPFFYTDIEITLEDEVDKVVSYSSLSSGEKQLINITSLVVYNIKCIQESQKNSENYFKYVGLIFDEIELYFHPNYQRRLVNHLIKSLCALQLNPQIRGIHIILATHSPFILSDIPGSNILCLENGMPKKNTLDKTFAANIYDLLNNRFFMRESALGEFSAGQIREIIQLYHKKDTEEKKKEVTEKYDRMSCIANQVGDIYIRNTLKEMIAEMKRNL